MTLCGRLPKALESKRERTKAYGGGYADIDWRRVESTVSRGPCALTASGRRPGVRVEWVESSR